MGTTRMLGRRDDGPAVFTYEAVPGVPPVSTIRFGRKLPPGGPPPRHAHSHDFLVLAYFERGDGSMWVRDREWLIEAGDGPAPGDAPAERPSWSERLSALDLELSQRQSGYQEAALAHLTLLLVGVGRLAVDVVGNLRFNDERLLAKVFGFIEDRYREPISLKDVARAVSLSRGTLPRSSGARRDVQCRSGSPSAAWRRHAGCSYRRIWRWRSLAKGSATEMRATS